MKPALLHTLIFSALAVVVILPGCDKPAPAPAVKEASKPEAVPADNPEGVEQKITLLRAAAVPVAPGESRTIPPLVRHLEVEVTIPAGVAAFDGWLARYLAAPPSERANYLAEGIPLAVARRAAIESLISSDPQSALLAAVPPSSRELLPEEIRGHLEEIVSAKGFYGVLSICNHGSEAPHGEACRIEYQAVPGMDFRKIYKASIYGSRVQRLTEENASLFGVAIGDRIALHEDDFVIRNAADVTSDPARVGQLAVTYMGETTFVADEAGLPAHLESLVKR